MEDCGDIGEHNKMTIALEKIKSLASSHPINSSTFDLGIFRFLFLVSGNVILICIMSDTFFFVL